MPDILWGFGEIAGIGKLGLCPQGAFSLWGRTNPEEAVTSRSIITGQPYPLGKDPLVRIQSWDMWG